MTPETIGQAFNFALVNVGERCAAVAVDHLQHAGQKRALRADQPGGGAGHDHRYPVVLVAGAQGVP